jgi:hypothetical protein
MASAILTVLYPDDFTVYDYRLCEQLGDFYNLATRSNFEDVWSGYETLLDRIRAATPDGLSLRDRDRYLWGKSAHEQLVGDIERDYNVRHRRLVILNEDEEIVLSLSRRSINYVRNLSDSTYGR